MPFVYIENNEVVSVLQHKAETPSSVEQIEISHNEYEGLFNESLIFDLSTRKVIENSNSQNVQKHEKNAELRYFLQSTDWKVLRHIRETNLKLDTSLTDEEYLELEQKRQQAAKNIDSEIE